MGILVKVLYHINDSEYNSAQRWIFDAWKSGFEARGHVVYTAASGRDLSVKVRKLRPDLIMSDLGMLKLPDDLDSLRLAKDAGSCIATWIHWPLTPQFRHLSHIFEEDFSTIYFGEREDCGQKFYNDTKLKYVCIPNSAHVDKHVHGKYREDLACDILYVGTKLPHKKWFQDNILKELKHHTDYNVVVYGLGWSRWDFFLKAIRKFFKLFGFVKIVDLIGKFTVKLSDEDERDMYASAKICLNFHEREPDGTQPHYIVNQRTFKVPACGGFQIVDEVPAIESYFKKNEEIVMLPLDKKDWMEAIKYYIKQDTLRKKIARQGHKRSRSDHLASNRVDKLINELGKHNGA